MTIERDSDELWRAVCDRCGGELFFEADERDRDDVEAEIVGVGWKAWPTVVVKFSGGGSAYREAYAEHDCPDCR